MENPYFQKASLIENSVEKNIVYNAHAVPRTEYEITLPTLTLSR